MSKYLLLILSLIVSSITFAQDIIVKRNGDSLVAKIIEIGIDEIKYWKNSNLDGPLYVIDKNEVENLLQHYTKVMFTYRVVMASFI